MRNPRNLGLILAAVLLGLPGCSKARVIEATPADVAARLAAARPGDTLKLGRGDYRDLKINNRRFSPALVIDARAAKLTELRLAKTQGVRIQGGSFGVGAPRRHAKSGAPVFGAAILMNDVEDVSISGGTFAGPGAGKDAGGFGEGYGVRVVGGKDVEIVNSRFSSLKIGVAMTRIDGFRLAENAFMGMRMDGMAVSVSRNGLIEKNECAGTRVRGDEHPDCIQMWSRPEAPPTADVVIRGNRITGSTQGIGLHNHVRNGVNDGGFDRITIEDNEIHVSRSNAINLQNARASVIRNNKVSTEPGARLDARIRSSGESVTICGNTVEAGSRLPAVKDKAC